MNLNELYLELIRSLWEKSVPGPPREIGFFLLFHADASCNAPHLVSVLDPKVQYVPTPEHDYSWYRHLKVS